MKPDKKKPQPSEHQKQNSNNLVVQNEKEKPPVPVPATESVRNSGRSSGLNQELIDNNRLQPSDSSDQ